MMMAIDLIQQVASFDVTAWSDIQGMFWHLDWSHLAKAGTQFDTDVFAKTRAFFDNFMKTGQIWAMIMGFVLGFLAKGMTSYG
jgi:hypothetical protein